MSESGCQRDVACQNLEVSGRTQLDTVSSKVPVVSITTATYPVSAGQTGTLFALNKADGITVTLPAPAAGLNFDFVVATAPTSNTTTIVTTSSANIIHGQITTSEDAGGSVACVAEADTITLVANTAIVGDRVQVVSDGTRYFVSGCVKLATAATTTQAS